MSPEPAPGKSIKSKVPCPMCGKLTVIEGADYWECTECWWEEVK